MSDRNDVWFNFVMVLFIFACVGVTIYGISIADTRHQSMTRWCEMKGFQSYYKDVRTKDVYCVGGQKTILQIPPEILKVFGDGTIRGQFK